MIDLKKSTTLFKAHCYYLVGLTALMESRTSNALDLLKRSQDLFEAEIEFIMDNETRKIWELELKLIKSTINDIQTHTDKSEKLADVKNDFSDQIMSMRRIYPKNKDWRDEVIGLELAKSTLDFVISRPLQNPEVWMLCDELSRSVLQFGPPGCGKTRLVKFIAVKTGLPLYNVTAGKIFSKWFGESEKKIDQLFQAAYQEEDGCILFFDEFDAIAGNHSHDSDAMARIQQMLLTALDGIDVPTPNKVIIIANTNRPDLLGGAMMRRFDRRIYIPPPDYLTIRNLIIVKTKKISQHLDFDSFEWKKLFKSMVGLTSDEVVGIIRESILNTFPQIIDEPESADMVLRCEIKELLTNTTPYFCTFDSVEPSVFLFLDHEYGRPKSQITEYSWEATYLKKKYELIQTHPFPQVIYKRQTHRQV